MYLSVIFYSFEATPWRSSLRASPAPPRKSPLSQKQGSRTPYNTNKYGSARHGNDDERASIHDITANTSDYLKDNLWYRSHSRRIYFFLFSIFRRKILFGMLFYRKLVFRILSPRYNCSPLHDAFSDGKLLYPHTPIDTLPPKISNIKMK